MYERPAEILEEVVWQEARNRIDARGRHFNFQLQLVQTCSLGAGRSRCRLQCYLNVEKGVI